MEDVSSFTVRTNKYVVMRLAGVVARTGQAKTRTIFQLKNVFGTGKLKNLNVDGKIIGVKSGSQEGKL